MLPNFSNLRVSSRRPQRGRLVRKSMPTEGKIPSLLMGTIEERELWYDANGKMPAVLEKGTPAQRAFWWFSENPDDPDTQDVVTFDSLADGYEPDQAQWNAHFWFWSGGPKVINKPLPIDSGTMPNPAEWVDQYKVLGVPAHWATAGPDAIIQVAPSKSGMPGEFAHKGALLLQFAMQRRNEPNGVVVKDAENKSVKLQYPDAYRGPGGTGRDLFVPLLTDTNTEAYMQMREIRDTFLKECEELETLVNGESVEGVKFYSTDKDELIERHGKSKQRNPFPTPWVWGDGTRPSHYDGTGFTVTDTRSQGLVAPMYLDDDDDDGNVEMDDEDGEADDYSPTAAAPEDINRLVELARRSATESMPDFVENTAAELNELLQMMVRRVDGDELYTDMLTDTDFHDDLWDKFKSSVRYLYALFERASGITNVDVRRLETEIIFTWLFQASNVPQMAEFIESVIHPNLRPLWLWRNDLDPTDEDYDAMLLALRKTLNRLGITQEELDSAGPLQDQQARDDAESLKESIMNYVTSFSAENWRSVKSLLVSIRRKAQRNLDGYQRFLVNDNDFRIVLRYLNAFVFGQPSNMDWVQIQGDAVAFLHGLIIPKTPGNVSTVRYLLTINNFAHNMLRFLDFTTAMQPGTELWRKKKRIWVRMALALSETIETTETSINEDAPSSDSESPDDPMPTPEVEQDLNKREAMVDAALLRVKANNFNESNYSTTFAPIREQMLQIAERADESSGEYLRTLQAVVNFREAIIKLENDIITYENATRWSQMKQDVIKFLWAITREDYGPLAFLRGRPSLRAGIEGFARWQEDNGGIDGPFGVHLRALLGRLVPPPAPMLRRNSSDGYQTRASTRQRREQETGATLRRPALLPRFFKKTLG